MEEGERPKRRAELLRYPLTPTTCLREQVVRAAGESDRAISVWTNPTHVDPHFRGHYDPKQQMIKPYPQKGVSQRTRQKPQSQKNS